MDEQQEQRDLELEEIRREDIANGGCNNCQGETCPWCN